MMKGFLSNVRWQSPRGASPFTRAQQILRRDRVMGKEALLTIQQALWVDKAL
jgi:hypothetical protein